jgi:hypothetical protein
MVNGSKNNLAVITPPPIFGGDGLSRLVGCIDVSTKEYLCAIG